jgi:crotonobetainyl-CoA:carnitine CoA-transferase CaiB-like acyl-CoA transferase
MLAAAMLADGDVPQRGKLPLAGQFACYRPYACKDGWVSCGALEPKFWQAWCRGVDREDLVEHQFAAPGTDGHRAIEEVFAARTRAEWAAFNAEHDCCVEPVLDLDEALDSELARARKMVVELAQPGAAAPVKLLGLPIKLDRTPGDAARAPGPALGEHTDEVLAAAGYGTDEIEALKAGGAVAGPASEATAQGSFLGG